MRNMAKSTIILILTALLCVVGIANDANSAYNPIPTGTGWRHVTGGFEDPAARAVNLASSDVTGSLPLSGSTSPTGTGLAKVSAGSWVSAASTLVDADVDAAAAIAGTKVNPNFGAQTISTTGPLILGATPPAIGRVRVPYVATDTIIGIKDSQGVDRNLLQRLSSNLYAIGEQTAFMDLNINGGTVKLLGTTGVQIASPGVGDYSISILTSGEIDIAKPMVGYTNQNSPYAVHGLATGIALPTTAATTTVITAARYSYNTLQFTGALTANQTVTLPGEADVGAYTKIIDNLCTGAFAVIVGASTGAGTVTIPNGTRATVLVDSRGVTMPIEAATGIAIGASPALGGDVRLGSTGSINFANGASDLQGLSSDGGGYVYLGKQAAGYGIAISTTDVIIGTTGSTLLRAGTYAFSGVPTIGLSVPLIGSNSPYGINGLSTVALPTTGSVTTTLSGAQYGLNTIHSTGALTANQTIALPGATDAGAYTKVIDNLCTGSFDVIVSATTGAGTVSVPSGTRCTVLIDSRGVTMPIEAATGIAIGSAPSSTGNIRGSSDLLITHNVGGVDRNVLDATSGADIILGDPTNGGSIINRAPAADLFYFQVGGNNLMEIDQNGVHVGVGGTDALTFGTSGYAASGLIRLPNNTNVIAFRNSGGTADMVAMATDTATLYLGYDNTGANAFTNTTVAASNGVQMVSGGHAVADFDTSVVDVGNATYTTQTSIRSSSNIYTQSATFTCQDAAATATRFKVDANNIYGSLPYIGTANDPHGVHGKTTVATGGTFTVGASDYIMDAVMFSYSSGVLAAFPAPANDGAAYYKTIINTGNATDYVHDTLPVGSVRNCTIPASSTMRVLFDLAGCHPVSASVSYP